MPGSTWSTATAPDWSSATTPPSAPTTWASGSCHRRSPAPTSSQRCSQKPSSIDVGSTNVAGRRRPGAARRRRWPGRGTAGRAAGSERALTSATTSPRHDGRGQAGRLRRQPRLGGGAVQGVAALVVLQVVLLRRRAVAPVLVGHRRHDGIVDAVAGGGGEHRVADPSTRLDGDLERGADEHRRPDADRLHRQHAREVGRREDPGLQPLRGQDPLGPVRTPSSEHPNGFGMPARNGGSQPSTGVRFSLAPATCEAPSAGGASTSPSMPAGVVPEAEVDLAQPGRQRHVVGQRSFQRRVQGDAGLADARTDALGLEVAGLARAEGRRDVGVGGLHRSDHGPHAGGALDPAGQLSRRGRPTRRRCTRGRGG